MRPAQLLYVRWQLHTQNWRSSSLPLQDTTHCALCVLFSSQSSYPWLQPTHSSAMIIGAFLWTCLPCLTSQTPLNSCGSSLSWLTSTFDVPQRPFYLFGYPSVSEAHPISWLRASALFSSSHLTNHGQYGCPKTVSFGVWELTPGRLYLPCRYDEKDVFVFLV